MQLCRPVPGRNVRIVRDGTETIVHRHAPVARLAATAVVAVTTVAWGFAVGRKKLVVRACVVLIAVTPKYVAFPRKTVVQMQSLFTAAILMKFVVRGIVVTLLPRPVVAVAVAATPVAMAFAVLPVRYAVAVRAATLLTAVTASAVPKVRSAVTVPVVPAANAVAAKFVVGLISIVVRTRYVAIPTKYVARIWVEDTIVIHPAGMRSLTRQVAEQTMKMIISVPGAIK